MNGLQVQAIEADLDCSVPAEHQVDVAGEEGELELGVRARGRLLRTIGPVAGEREAAEGSEAGKW